MRTIHDINKAVKNAKNAGDTRATVGTWLINDADSHPVWNQYCALLLSLADLPGMKPARKVKPHLTHELHLYAINPEHPISKKNAPQSMIYFLTPPNHALQFAADSDRAAAQRVLEVLHAAPSMDSDFRQWWLAQFTDAETLIKCRIS